MYGPVEEPVRDPECLAAELEALKGSTTTWDALRECAGKVDIDPAQWPETTWQRIMGGNLARPGAWQRSYKTVTGKWQALAVILVVAHCGALANDFDRMIKHVERALRCWIAGDSAWASARGPAGLSDPPDQAGDMVGQVRGMIGPEVDPDVVRHYIGTVYATPG